MKILITGGAGYIGSITNRMLSDLGYQTVIFDNLSTGHKESIGNTLLVQGDLKNPADVEQVFSEHKFDAVIHFAALALAGESMQLPYEYFRNNISGGLNLVESMHKHGCTRLIFSSTCAVYGYPDTLPVRESESFKPVSVYGASKRIYEEVLEWYGKIYGIRYAFLRYFNAAGAWEDGSLGENHPLETHIIPIAIQVAQGKRKEFEIYGNDYRTKDGTCIRDYIHVMDLADAHIKAIQYLTKKDQPLVVNLGVGQGYSNLEIIEAVEKVSGSTIKTRFVPRRPGDPDSIYADNTQARSLLGWEPRFKSIESIIKTAWLWHIKHPDGY